MIGKILKMKELKEEAASGGTGLALNSDLITM